MPVSEDRREWIERVAVGGAWTLRRRKNRRDLLTRITHVRTLNSFSPSVILKNCMSSLRRTTGTWEHSSYKRQ